MSQTKSDELLVFDDLAPREYQFPYAGQTYLVREATEGAATSYRNAAMRATRMADGKVIGMEGMADIEPLLVSLCLSVVGEKKVGDETKRTLTPVSKATLAGWPSRVVKPIFQWIKDNSDLGENETEEQLEKLVKDAAEKLEKLKAVALLSRLSAALAASAVRATPVQETNGHPLSEGESEGGEGNAEGGPLSRTHKIQPLG